MKFSSTLTRITLFTGIIALLSGCDTEVDLLAPYKTTPVIYGVLDYAADTQFVRINKTFLGEGDASVYAGIKDSVEYPIDQVEAVLYKYQDNDLKDSITLEVIDIPSREPGAFYTQNVRYYYTAQPLFTDQEIADIDEMRYEIRVDIKGKTYVADTEFPNMDSGDITYPPVRANPFKLDLVAFSGALRILDFEFETNSSVAEYEATFRTYFDYYTESGEYKENQYLDFPLGSINNTAGNAIDRKVVFASADWFDFFGRNLDLIPGLKNVRLDYMEFRLTGAASDLVTYVQVARPVSDFTPVLSTYTNFSNGAVGVFSAKGQLARAARLLDPAILALNNEPSTGAYCFCALDWEGSNYVCDPDPAVCP